MLVDDDKRFVELMVDNIVWGNVTINWKDIDRPKDEKEEERFDYMLGQYVGLRRTNPTDSRLDALVDGLATHFHAERFFGKITGELRDRDHEKKIENLTNDNEKLAERLSQAYVPSTDSKIGTT